MKFGGPCILLILMLLFSATVAVLGAVLSKLLDWIIE